MAARFEIYADADDRIRFRLVSDEGALMLTSRPYESENEAITGIWSLRGTAATGPIVDLTNSLTPYSSLTS